MHNCYSSETLDTWFIYFHIYISIIAHEQEEEEEDDDDEEGEDEEEEDDNEDEEEEDEEAEEKDLKKMEEQRSQGKVRDFWSLFLDICVSVSTNHWNQLVSLPF